MPPSRHSPSPPRKPINFELLTTTNNTPYAVRFGGFLTVELVKGDITRAQVDVITNPANSSLSHGGGIAGALSKACGP